MRLPPCSDDTTNQPLPDPTHLSLFFRRSVVLPLARSVSEEICARDRSAGLTKGSDARRILMNTTISRIMTALTVSFASVAMPACSDGGEPVNVNSRMFRQVGAALMSHGGGCQSI